MKWQHVESPKSKYTSITNHSGSRDGWMSAGEQPSPSVWPVHRVRWIQSSPHSLRNRRPNLSHARVNLVFSRDETRIEAKIDYSSCLPLGAYFSFCFVSLSRSPLISCSSFPTSFPRFFFSVVTFFNRSSAFFFFCWRLFLTPSICFSVYLVLREL